MEWIEILIYILLSNMGVDNLPNLSEKSPIAKE